MSATEMGDVFQSSVPPYSAFKSTLRYDNLIMINVHSAKSSAAQAQECPSPLIFFFK